MNLIKIVCIVGILLILWIGFSFSTALRKGVSFTQPHRGIYGVTGISPFINQELRGVGTKSGWTVTLRRKKRTSLPPRIVLHIGLDGTILLTDPPDAGAVVGFDDSE